MSNPSSLMNQMGEVSQEQFASIASKGDEMSQNDSALHNSTLHESSDPNDPILRFINELLPSEPLQDQLSHLSDTQGKTIEILKASIRDVTAFNDRMISTKTMPLERERRNSRARKNSSASTETYSVHPTDQLKMNINVCTRWVNEIKTDLNYIHQKIAHLQKITQRKLTESEIE